MGCSAITKSLASMTSVGKDELARAKAMLKGSLFRQMDDDANLLQDVGVQILTTGRYTSPADIARAIDATTEEQVSSMARRLLSGRPTVAAFGDTHAVPHISAIESALKA